MNIGGGVIIYTYTRTKVKRSSTIVLTDEASNVKWEYYLFRVYKNVRVN